MYHKALKKRDNERCCQMVMLMVKVRRSFCRCLLKCRCSLLFLCTGNGVHLRWHQEGLSWKLSMLGVVRETYRSCHCHSESLAVLEGKKRGSDGQKWEHSHHLTASTRRSAPGSNPCSLRGCVGSGDVGVILEVMNSSGIQQQHFCNSIALLLAHRGWGGKKENCSKCFTPHMYIIPLSTTQREADSQYLDLRREQQLGRQQRCELLKRNRTVRSSPGTGILEKLGIKPVLIWRKRVKITHSNPKHI